MYFKNDTNKKKNKSLYSETYNTIILHVKSFEHSISLKKFKRTKDNHHKDLLHRKQIKVYIIYWNILFNFSLGLYPNKSSFQEIPKHFL